MRLPMTCTLDTFATSRRRPAVVFPSCCLRWRWRSARPRRHAPRSLSRKPCSTISFAARAVPSATSITTASSTFRPAAFTTPLPTGTWSRCWKSPRSIDPHGYSKSFCNFAEDINGDGRTDLIVVGFPGEATHWFEQPEKEGAALEAARHCSLTNNESPGWYDIDGDGAGRVAAGLRSGRLRRLCQADRPIEPRCGT